VPAVHVLLPQAGGALLKAQKGYSVPQPCAAKASFLVTEPDDDLTLQTALLDETARGAALRHFDTLYATRTPQTPLLVKAIAGIIA
jgi:hypothetical protein